MLGNGHNETGGKLTSADRGRDALSEQSRSTNAALLASLEALQTFNESLSARNDQLHESLERQRATSDDLRHALIAAARRAERTNVANTRFLAAASHDLRQPLQSLALIQPLLGKTIEGGESATLLIRLDQAIGAMSGLVDALLDGERTDAGAIRAETIGFCVEIPPPRTDGNRTPGPIDPQLVFIVDDDPHIRDGLRGLLEETGRTVETYPSCESFLAAHRPGQGACLLIDAYLPGMSGLALLHRLRDGGDRLPAIMITGNSDVAMAVAAMKAGAFDFIEKPIGGDDLLAGVQRAVDQWCDANTRHADRESAAKRLAGLTRRQRQVLDRVLAGQPSKNIAADLGVSQRTVENHRAAIMRKTGSKSLPALTRLVLAAAGAENGPAAGWCGPDGQSAA